MMKQIHLIQTSRFKTTVCKQMEHELSTHRCQAKPARSHHRAKESDVTPTDSVSLENSCECSQNANSLTQPASTEEIHQEIKKLEKSTLGWESFVPKVRNKIRFFFYLHGTISGRGSIATPSVLMHVSHKAIFPKSKNEFLGYWRIS